MLQMHQTLTNLFSLFNILPFPPILFAIFPLLLFVSPLQFSQLFYLYLQVLFLRFSQRRSCVWLKITLFSGQTFLTE